MYQYKTILGVFLAIVISCLWFSACFEPPQKTYTIGFSQCCADAWRDVMNSEMARELAFHPELSFEIRVSDNNSEKQVAQIRELVEKKVDLLMVTSKN